MQTELKKTEATQTGCCGIDERSYGDLCGSVGDGFGAVSASSCGNSSSIQHSSIFSNDSMNTSIRHRIMRGPHTTNALASRAIVVQLCLQLTACVMIISNKHSVKVLSY